ncbi:putative uracil phosphoribosyltransferase [Thermococcus cleftensis]|uniref:Uracil phosphoribosyltransferase n=1 Tax=Thermococcus cleftensis (strain DSM 27260 / KACC 17922 / CL1) TaxID=163003 RepID=I3ZSN5_THECF|nr:uracil phosphoribosyltransferase [Thermococcus cleftensis]AFL94719.1 putative uracil phosphoribosyltransferase [Thermococcus cleftensis]
MIEDRRWKGVYSFEDSPFIMEILTELRDERTGPIPFRKGLVKLGRYMAYELTKTMETEKVPVRTPLEETEGVLIKDRRNVVIITVLRAAIPLMEGLIKVLDHARVGIVSASRGKAPKFEIEMKYVKVPQVKPEDTVIIADPMIATGSTLIRVLDEVKKYGKAKRYVIVGVLAAPEGISRIKEAHPDVEMFVAAIDRELNEKGYILPGLGDAGDRAFGAPIRV